LWRNEVIKDLRTKGTVEHSDDAIALLKSIGLGLDVTKIEPIGKALDCLNNISNVYDGYANGYAQARARVDDRITAREKRDHQIVIDAVASPAPTPLQIVAVQGPANRVAIQPDQTKDRKRQQGSPANTDDEPT
jgi:hypothetical protein